MSPVPETVAVEPAAPPDAEFADLVRAALVTIQEQAGRAATSLRPERAWTDHNAHDPGITLLEATAWALADLHYRTEAREFEAWSLEAAEPWRGARLPHAGREEMEDALRTAAAAVASAVAESPSRARAVTAVAGRAAIGVEAAEGAVRLLREPLLLRAALDHAGMDAEALAAELGLWPEEVDDLRRRERRRAAAQLLGERPDAIVAAVDAARAESAPDTAVWTVLDERLGLTGADAEAALSLVPCPPLPPETWEREPDGATTLWPPHPLQARTCEPVTASDYLRLFQSDPLVRRAWIVPGLAAGTRWNGANQATARPFRRGALTIVVEPEGTPASGFRADLIRRTIGAAEVDAPNGLVDHRSAANAAAPRRLLGDELCVALVGTCALEVDATLQIEPGGGTEVARLEAEDRLRKFLSAARLLPPDMAELPPPARRLVCPQELEGPWPAPAAVDELLRDPDAFERETGWRPGEPVRVAEVAQLLQSIPGVVGVELLQVRRVGAADWETETAELDRFCVPLLDDSCLCVAVAERGECGG